MQCLNCKNEAKGRSRYCSDKCKVSYNRNKKRNNEPENVTVNPTSVTESPQSVTNGQLTVSDIKTTLDNLPNYPMSERILIPVMLKKLPVGVVRPTGQPDEHTSQRTAEQLHWAMGCRAHWQSSPEYAEMIYRLLTMTVEKLEEIGQFVPNWKLKVAV